ncbi:polysaccharide deacetylase [Paenibacillus xylaniclasticus]|uniref:polysaccharide deacetylase n=1 Tax=Paenibacillus xylaniclasticus TaxID=588083 RepID=UPI0013DF76FF|nr:MULTISPECIES: polysaccharide deacetylase [Paenibacillus]GFN33313.1 hypothetical protein PCURB6_35730 [Paenibacillus curdlanolyticus]
MFRRRIVRAVYAVIIAVSAAALSGWFVEQGAAVGEAGWNEQVRLAPQLGQTAAADSTERLNGQPGTGGHSTRVTTANHEAGLAEETTAADNSAGQVHESGRLPGGIITVVRGAAGMALAESGRTYDMIDKEQEKKIVYLTFDDGPSKLTPQVLDLLKKEGIQATFFVLGEQVKQHPDLLKRIVAEGHTVGNHSYNHEYKELYSGFGQFADQIVRTEQELQAAAGIRTRLVRAPGGTFGNFDQSYFDAMEQAGYTMFDWNVDSGDSVRIGVPAAEIINNVRSSKRYPETIVLLHDSASHAESVKALPDIIGYYKGLGYTFAPLTEFVEPVTFRVADKLKWSRPKATASEQAVVRKGLDAGAGSFIWSGGLGRNTAGAAAEEAELVVNNRNRTVIFEPGAYSTVGEDWHVPLRELAEGLGGTVRWSAEERRAVADMPDGARVVVTVDNGDSFNVQGKVYVRLRDVLTRMYGQAVEPVWEESRIVLTVFRDEGT